MVPASLLLSNLSEPSWLISKTSKCSNSVSLLSQFGRCPATRRQLCRNHDNYCFFFRTKDSASEIVKYLLMCLQCCLWCFEKVMKFINRNAYIYTGTYSNRSYNFSQIPLSTPLYRFSQLSMLSNRTIFSIQRIRILLIS